MFFRKIPDKSSKAPIKTADTKLVFVYIMMKFFVLGGSGIGVSTVTDGFILWGLILLAGFMAARPFEGGK